MCDVISSLLRELKIQATKNMFSSVNLMNAWEKQWKPWAGYRTDITQVVAVL